MIAHGTIVLKNKAKYAIDKPAEDEWNLIINHVEQSDEANYTCKVMENGNLVKVTKRKLSVDSKSSFTLGSFIIGHSICNHVNVMYYYPYQYFGNQNMELCIIDLKNKTMKDTRGVLQFGGGGGGGGGRVVQWCWVN